MIDPVVDRTIRVALALLFAAAAAHKLGDVRGFRSTLAAYRVVPAALVGGVAMLVVTVEIGIAALLVLGGPMGPLAAAALLVAYAAAIGTNLARGRRTIDCGCVGVAGRDGIGWELVLRNVLLALAACAALLPEGARATTWMDHVTVAGGVLGLAALYAATDGLLANATTYRRLREAT
jgi:hypothetical protein